MQRIDLGPGLWLNVLEPDCVPEQWLTARSVKLDADAVRR
jgi:hypothetical protein